VFVSDYVCTVCFKKTSTNSRAVDIVYAITDRLTLCLATEKFRNRYTLSSVAGAT
jgi:hypothetical protein